VLNGVVGGGEEAERSITAAPFVVTVVCYIVAYGFLILGVASEMIQFAFVSRKRVLELASVRQSSLPNFNVVCGEM